MSGPDPDETRASLEESVQVDPAEEFVDECLDLLSEGDISELLAMPKPGELAPGSTIHDYRLVRRIGAGAMGEVWIARQASLNRLVALKILRSDAATRRTRTLFEREARAMARLQQAHIVTVHDTGTSDARMWIAQELIETGRTFADVLDDQRDARDAGEEIQPGLERKTVKFFLCLARAVAHAHGQGVLHRDLKPANVLVTETGEPKIADFGLALLREAAQQGELGLSGTPSYMSPEQVASQVYGLDERTDVFSLGVMFFEALLLRRPFESESIDNEVARREIFEKIVTKEADESGAEHRRLPRKLRAICARCLEKDRSRRYPSAHALAEDLERFLDNLPLQSLPDLSDADSGQGTGEAYNPNSGHPGQYLGPFRLIRFLDRGRQGEVWEAFDINMERPVALKIVAVEGRTQSQIDRFENDARAAGRCEHPAIINVYQSGESHGILWIAMELVEGAKTLRVSIEEKFGADERTVLDNDVVSNDSPTDFFRERALFFAELAEALAAVHDQGIIHRDIKPSNILVDRDGRPRMIDFGTARMLDSVGGTQTHERVGTPRYMSPEQINPDLYELDGRSDIFATGICLYEALSGMHPFEADTSQGVQHKILHERPLTLSRIVTRLPTDLGTICATALEKVRDERYTTIGDLAADLRAFAEGRPISARETGHGRRALRWARRHQLEVLVVLILFTSLTGLVAMGSQQVKAAATSATLQSTSNAARRGDVLDTLTALLGGQLEKRGGARHFGELLAALDGQRDLLTHGPSRLATAAILDGHARLGDGRGLIAAWQRNQSSLELAAHDPTPTPLPFGLVAIVARDGPQLYAHIGSGDIEGLPVPPGETATPAMRFERIAPSDPEVAPYWQAVAPPTTAQWARLSDTDFESPQAAAACTALGWTPQDDWTTGPRLTSLAH